MILPRRTITRKPMTCQDCSQAFMTPSRVPKPRSMSQMFPGERRCQKKEIPRQRRKRITAEYFTFKMDFLFCMMALFLTVLTNGIRSEDVFCGSLKIHKQQWLDRSVVTLSSQTTGDLKECLDSCCKIQNCNAVTYIGFMSNSTLEDGGPNCLLFTCQTPSACVAVDRPIANDGVVSVVIDRTVDRSSSEANNTVTVEPTDNGILNSGSVLPSSPDDDIDFGSESGPTRFPLPPTPDYNNLIETTKNLDNDRSGRTEDETRYATPAPSEDTDGVHASTLPSSPFYFLHVTPVWAVGLAITLAIAFVGVNVVLLCAYCCYRQHRGRARSENFTINPIKTPTLHAFNPTT